MFKYLKSLFYPPPIRFIEEFDIKNKTNKELIEILENEILSLASGNKMVLEILKRLVNKNDS